MTKKQNTLSIILIYILILFIIDTNEVFAQVPNYPCATPSPLPYPESNTCLQDFLSVHYDCCNIDFDMSCYNDMNQYCSNTEVNTWTNCYDYSITMFDEILAPHPDCISVNIPFGALWVHPAFNCCSDINCNPCTPNCEPPPNTGTCPLLPEFPYDGCLIEIILFDGGCTASSWDMCCKTLYDDLSSGVIQNTFLSNEVYEMPCRYRDTDFPPPNVARYPCDDLDPLTIDQCHPVIGCMNVPNYANITPSANIKLWLQGASLGAVMTTNPNISSSQPFNTTPWNYAGSEGGAIPDEAVDWILVEALDVNDFTILDQAAGFLLEDGTVQDIDGTIGQIKFQSGTLNSTDNYYIAVRVRGHLDVLSAVPISVLGTTQYDFTTDAVQAYQTLIGGDQGQMVEANGTGTGAPYALYSGDANGDGIINFEDFNDYFLQIGAGYKTADFNHDGTVNGSDFNPYFTSNNGKMNIQKLRY